MSDPKQCAHKGCSCLAREHSNFCSQFCEDSKDLTTIACDCGHPGCAAHS